MAHQNSAVILPFETNYQTRHSNDRSAQHHVSIEELLTTEFIVRYSRFNNLGAFFNASGLEPRSLVSLDIQTRGLWDVFIRAVSNFPDWEAMLRRARGEWLLRRLGIAVHA